MRQLVLHMLISTDENHENCDAVKSSQQNEKNSASDDNVKFIVCRIVFPGIVGISLPLIDFGCDIYVCVSFIYQVREIQKSLINEIFICCISRVYE